MIDLMTKSLKEKVVKEVDKVKIENQRQNEKQKAINKCLKEKVFTFVGNANDEDDMG